MPTLQIFIRSFALLATTFSLPACNAVATENETRNARPVSQVSEHGLQEVPLSIMSSEAVHRFTVELAQTAEEQARGLMFRTELQPDAGMVFPFAKDRIASFWMKNTVIPLDIIFVRRDGTIESIAANTVPYSLDPVQSREPVAAVLEIAGGRAAELGIAPGDKISW